MRGSDASPPLFLIPALTRQVSEKNSQLSTDDNRYRKTIDSILLRLRFEPEIGLFEALSTPLRTERALEKLQELGF